MPMTSTLERSALRGWFKVCTRLSKMAGVILLYRFPCPGYPRRAWPIPAAGLGPGGVLVVGSYTAYIGLRSGRRRVTLLSVGNRVSPRVVPASPHGCHRGEINHLLGAR